MAKKPTITNVASGYQSTTTVNDNFNNVRNAFDNTLSLDGSTPNAMLANLDMNSYNIINANVIDANTLSVGGLAVITDNIPYLGDSATNPTTRLNGDPLETGDLYFNTTNDRMRVYETGTGWIDYEATAQTAASTATTQAGIATTQAGIATTQASAALASATTASTKAGEAATSATAAASARDAAIIGAGVYVDEATGRAAVADGVAFKVQGSGDVAAYEYRRVNAGSSTLIATYPSSSAVGITTQSGFPKPLVATGTTVPALYTIAPETAAPSNGYVTDVSIGAAAAGEATISVITINTGTGVVTAITASTQLSVAAGVATYTLNLPIAAGQYVAITGSNYKYQAGAPGGRSVWAKSGSVLAVSNTLTFATAHRFEINFTIESGARAELSLLQDSALTESSLNSDLTTLVDVGFPDPVVATGSTAPSTYTIFPRNPVVEGGVLTGLTVGSASAGSMNIYVASITSGGVITIISTTTVSTIAGINT
jgi:hypothetical protein